MIKFKCNKCGSRTYDTKTTPGEGFARGWHWESTVKIIFVCTNCGFEEYLEGSFY